MGLEGALGAITENEGRSLEENCAVDLRKMDEFFRRRQTDDGQILVARWLR